MMDEGKEKMERLENKTDTIARDVKRLIEWRSTERKTRVMFVWVEFHPQRYKIGQDEINRALEDGYEILWDYKYDNGVEFCLKKPVKKTSKVEHDG